MLQGNIKAFFARYCILYFALSCMSAFLQCIRDKLTFINRFRTIRFTTSQTCYIISSLTYFNVDFAQFNEFQNYIFMNCYNTENLSLDNNENLISHHLQYRKLNTSFLCREFISFFSM